MELISQCILLENYLAAHYSKQETIIIEDIQVDNMELNLVMNFSTFSVTKQSMNKQRYVFTIVSTRINLYTRMIQHIHLFHNYIHTGAKFVRCCYRIILS